MSYFKLGFIFSAAALMLAPSSAEAQNFTQRGTRNGAIAGAIIGGLIGDQNNKAFTGVVIGGLVGGAAGRAIGRSKDANFYGGNQVYGGNQIYGGNQFYRQGNLVPYQSYYGGGIHRTSFGTSVGPVHRGYSGYRGSHYGGGGFGGGPVLIGGW